ncbi:MAG: glycosyltransferase [Bacteroidota bacterium]
MIKILHISSATTWRGGEQQIAYLVEELAKNKVEQHLFCVSGGMLEQWCIGNNISHTSYRKWSSIAPDTAKKLAVVYRQENCTAIHTHDSHAHTYAYLAVQVFRCAAPIIVHRRVDFPIKNSLFSSWKYNHCAIQAIICVSEAIRQIIRPSIVAKDKIKVVHDGIDVNRFQETTLNLHQCFQLHTDTKVIGNVAAIADHKDHITFVDTLEQLLVKGMDVHGVIVGGDGGVRIALEEHIAKKSLDKHITLTGFRSDVVAILPAFDVFLFTSKEEGLGTSILDAFAAKVPVVATRAGGIPEIVKHTKTGLLADVGDAMQLAQYVEQVLSKLEVQQLLTQNASRQLLHYTKKQMTTKILSLYQTILT